MTEPAPEDRRVELLTRARDAIVVAPLDAGRLVGLARSRRRRRRGAAAAALASVLVVAVLAVTNLGGDDSPVRPADAVDADRGTTPFPAPPAGMKWAGRNGVVVAVPEQWPVSESPCGTGAPGEVLDGTATGDAYCVNLDAADEVVFMPLAADPDPPTELLCLESATPICHGGRVFADQGFSVSVRIQADDAKLQVDRILASAMVLPAGWTTVPFGAGAALAERVRRLESAGFSVEVTDAGAIGRFNARTAPELGAPVEEGATITLSPAPVPEEASNSAMVTQSPQQIAVGDREGPLDLEGVTLEGEDLRLADLRGEVVVVNVWGSWCTPCRAETRLLAEAQTALGVPFVGVNSRDDLDSARAYQRAQGVDYPSIYDPTGQALTAFGQRHTPGGFPATYLLDRRGRLAAVVSARLTSAEALTDLVRGVQAESR